MMHLIFNEAVDHPNILYMISTDSYCAIILNIVSGHQMFPSMMLQWLELG